MNSASATTRGPLVPAAAHSEASRLRRGYLLGLLGVALFALTIPMTRLASGSTAFGFAYVSLFSMWLGFFAWYRALALGGTVRVSQVQLLQPFLSILAAVPILGEAVDAATGMFLLAVMAVVFASRRAASSAPPTQGRYP